jgi:hypothetical protein
VPLLSEQLFLDVLESFDFDGIAAGIQEEHGALFAGLAFESHVRLDDERDLRTAQFLLEDIEVEEIEDRAEVWDGNAVTVGDVRDGLIGAGGIFVGEVTDELMAEEIEVHPLTGAAPFVAAQYFAVELPGHVEVADPYRQVKRRKAIHGS